MNPLASGIIKTQKIEIAKKLLTLMQGRIVSLLVRGNQRKTIANHLKTSVNTVNKHIANIYLILDVHNATRAVALALDHGFDSKGRYKGKYLHEADRN